MKHPLHFLFAVLLCYLPGILGSAATVENMEPWYEGLNKPSFNPPDWIFGPVWTLLYTLMAFSLYFVMEKKTPAAKRASVFFVIHLFVNAAWSFVFFGMHQISWALGVIAVMWMMILISMILNYRVNKVSAYLLLPYLLWVSFAGVLNWSVLALN